jgi:hypothetical protein
MMDGRTCHRLQFIAVVPNVYHLFILITTIRFMFQAREMSRATQILLFYRFFINLKDTGVGTHSDALDLINPKL